MNKCIVKKLAFDGSSVGGDNLYKITLSSLGGSYISCVGVGAFSIGEWNATYNSSGDFADKYTLYHGSPTGSNVVIDNFFTLENFSSGSSKASAHNIERLIMAAENLSTLMIACDTYYDFTSVLSEHSLFVKCDLNAATFDLKTIVEAWSAKGKNDTCAFGCYNNTVKFGGIAMGSANYTIDFSSNVVTIASDQAGSVIHSYNRTTGVWS